MKELLLNVGAGGSGPAPAVGGGGATGGAPAAAEKEEEKKEEEKEESDDDMVRPLLLAHTDPGPTDYLFRALVFSINLLEPLYSLQGTNVSVLIPHVSGYLQSHPAAYDRSRTTDLRTP